MKLCNFMPDPNSNLTIPEQMQKYHEIQMQQQFEQTIGFILIPLIMAIIAFIIIFGPSIYRKIKQRKEAQK